MKSKPKFRVGQVVMWRRLHPHDASHPCIIEEIEDGYLDGPRYHVSMASAPQGWEEKRFRPLTERERGKP